MQYRLIDNSDCIQMNNGEGYIATVPNDMGNADRQTYQAWLDLGNTPLASDVDWE